MEKSEEAFAGLSWEDIRQWAGGTILNRGKSYVKNVSGLGRTEDGEWAAWVSGSEEYATTVMIDDDGEIDSFCTCPYEWGPCKHAVAVILAGIEYVKAGQKIPLLDDEDDLFLLLFADPDEDDAFFYDDDFDESDPCGPDSSMEKKAQNMALLIILGKKKKQELFDLLLDLSNRFPEVRRRIMENEQLATGQVDTLADTLRREIQEVTSEDSWCSRWNDEGNLPDYSHIQEQLAALLKKGHADVVVELGRELWEGGNEQVAQFLDDGYTAMEITECMEIVFKAVCSSSLSAPEQLIRLIEFDLEDQYSLADSAVECIRRKKYTRAHWLEVSEILRERLKGLPKPGGNDFSARYHRERLMNWLIRALEESGRQEETIPLLENEVTATQCYGRLVNAYIGSGQREKARKCCVRGYNATINDAPGIAVGLRNTLRELAAKEKRFDLAAAYLAEEFFDSPGRDGYRELRKAAEKVKAWPEVRSAVLCFLETGNRPATEKKTAPKKWPLPVPEVKDKATRDRRNRAPYYKTMIDIAILEKRFDDVVQLYRQWRKTAIRGTCKGNEVADAVAETHPDTALAIWKQLAVARINRVKPREYEAAAGYLRRMRKVYQKTKRLDEWRQLILELRTGHRAKRRLMEVLDSLEGKRLID